MHERSITVQRNGRWVNLNGVTHQVLQPQFPFESRSYLSLPAADFAARQRSAWTGRLIGREEFSPLIQLLAAAVHDYARKVGSA